MNNQRLQVINLSIAFVIVFTGLFILLILSIIMPLTIRYLLLLTSSILCIISGYYYVTIKRLDSTYLIFLISYTLYGLSAPISILFFDVDFPRYNFNIYTLEKFADVYAIGLIAIIFGAMIVTFKNYWNNNKSHISPQNSILNNIFSVNSYFPVFLGFLASVSNIYNIYRSGSLASIVLGKGAFYMMIGDLYFSFLTTPLSYAAIFIYVHTRDRAKKISWRGILLFISLFPLIFTYTTTGERSSLIALIIVWLFSTSQFTGLKYKTKHLFSFMLLVISMAIILSVRSWLPGYILGINSAKPIKIESIVKYINPAESEFHTGSGNFTTYINDPMQMDRGITYIEVPVNIFPRWSLPFNKPTEVSIQFNKTYHPDLDARNIGVGFSSWVEGHMNGGLQGVFIHFFLISILSLLIDHYRFTKNHIIFGFITIGITPLFLKLNRASIANLFASSVELIVCWLFILFIVFIFSQKLIIRKQ